MRPEVPPSFTRRAIRTGSSRDRTVECVLGTGVTPEFEERQKAVRHFRNLQFVCGEWWEMRQRVG